MGNEFLVKFREMIMNNHVIMVRPTISRDFKERNNRKGVQTIGNILHMFKVQNMVCPWDSILASTTLALKTMVHSTI